jgi:two-component sensor histidine kinase
MIRIRSNYAPGVKMGDVEGRGGCAGQGELYRLACLAAEIGVWDWELSSGTISLCPLARKVLGLPSEGPICLADIRALTHPDDAVEMRAALDRALDPEIRSRESYVYRIRRGDSGDIRWLRANGVATFGIVEGRTQAVHYSGSIEDITEREHMRRALVESEARLRVALDAARMAVWELDIESDTVAPSAELNRLYRFPEDARPSANDFRRRYAQGEAERLAQAGAEARRRGETQIQTAVRHVFPDGTERTFMLRAALAPADCTGRERAIGVVFDITDQARQEERVETLTHELRHRLKNMATLVAAIAAQTWPRDDRYEGFLGRVRALAAATDLMFGNETRSATVQELLESVLMPFRAAHEAIDIHGPQLPVPEPAISGLAMAFHELATNAVKHGALSVPDGRVSVNWHHRPDDGALCLRWTERGGPPVSPPDQEGFGTQLLRRGALPPPNEVKLLFEPGGLVACICVRSERPV